MKLTHARSSLTEMARRGFRGHPLATVAYYGPDDQRATKVAVGIIVAEGAEPSVMERWSSKDGDVRQDALVRAAIVEFLKRHRVRSVVLVDRIIGCPHEEGADYPVGQTCPECPFWEHRDRWTGEVTS